MAVFPSTIRALVQKTLPDFGEGTPFKGRFLRFARVRTDGLFECALFQRGGTRDAPKVYPQFAVHIFEECPIPAYPLGIDAGLSNMLQGQRMTPVADNWYALSDKRAAAKETAPDLHSAIAQYVRPTLDHWACLLTANAVVMFARELYAAPWPDDWDERRQFLFARFSELSRLNGLPEDTTRDIPRIVQQLMWRRDGSRNWYL